MFMRRLSGCVFVEIILFKLFGIILMYLILYFYYKMFIIENILDLKLSLKWIRRGKF